MAQLESAEFLVMKPGRRSYAQSLSSKCKKLGRVNQHREAFAGVPAGIGSGSKRKATSIDPLVPMSASAYVHVGAPHGLMAQQGPGMNVERNVHDLSVCLNLVVKNMIKHLDSIFRCMHVEKQKQNREQVQIHLGVSYRLCTQTEYPRACGNKSSTHFCLLSEGRKDCDLHFKLDDVNQQVREIPPE